MRTPFNAHILAVCYHGTDEISRSIDSGSRVHVWVIRISPAKPDVIGSKKQMTASSKKCTNQQSDQSTQPNRVYSGDSPRIELDYRRPVSASSCWEVRHQRIRVPHRVRM